MTPPFALRPLTLADAEAVSSMFRAYAAELDLVVPDDPDAIRHRLQGPRSVVGRDAVAATVNGRIAGVIAFQHTEEARIWGFVARPFRRRGIGTALLRWGIERARAETGLTQVFVGTSSRRADALALYRRLGFHPARTFNEMVHADPGTIARDPWPPGVSIRGDLEMAAAVATAVDVYNRAFVDHWDFRQVSTASIAHLIGEPGAGPSLSFFAYLHGRAVAMCLCRLEEGRGFVNELGTDPAARRRGAAATLLNHAMVEMAARGAGQVELDVDADNPTGAVRLYEAAGMVTTSAFSVLELGLRVAGNPAVAP